MRSRFLSCEILESRLLLAGNDVIFYTDGSATLNVYNVTTATWSVTTLSAPRSSAAVSSTCPQALFAGGAVNGRALSATVDVYTAPATPARARRAVFADKQFNAWDPGA